MLLFTGWQRLNKSNEAGAGRGSEAGTCAVSLLPFRPVLIIREAWGRVISQQGTPTEPTKVPSGVRLPAVSCIMFSHFYCPGQEREQVISLTKCLFFSLRLSRCGFQALEPSLPWEKSLTQGWGQAPGAEFLGC